MPVEMRTHLLFCFRDEAETPPVTENAAQGTDRECTAIPERAQATPPGAKFSEALLAPRQVIGLFRGGRLHLPFEFRIACHCGMTLVQRLRGNLPGMIHAHEARGVTAVARVEFVSGELFGGVGAA